MIRCCETVAFISEIFHSINFDISRPPNLHYDDVIMSTIATQITSLTVVYSTVYVDADQRKHQSSASLAFVRGIHRGPVNSPHKWPVTRKMFPFDDVIMGVVKTRPHLVCELIQHIKTTTFGRDQLWCLTWLLTWYWKYKYRGTSMVYRVFHITS